MKCKIYLVIVGVLLWTFPISMVGQQQDLTSLLEGKETFQQITETVEQYLETMPEGNEKDRLEKHFTRWAYYRSLHLGPDGEMVNISQKTWDAVANLPDAPTTTPNGSWTFVGPSTSTNNNPLARLNGIGRVDRMAFHPSNANIMYIGTPAGGLWKTTNGGLTWNPISNYIPSLGISGIVVDHSDPDNTIYVMTGDGDSYTEGFVQSSGYIRLSVGVVVTHDGGSTWQQTGPMSANDFAGYRLVQHPTNTDILIAATSDGIYRTIDGGDTWNQERMGKHYDVEFRPGNPTYVYATAPGAFVYSTNTGDTWNTNATFDVALCAGGRVEIAVTPDYPSKVYLLAGPVIDSVTFCGFYRSINSGSSFTRLCNHPNVLGKEDSTGNDQSNYDMGVAARPDNDLIVVVGGLVMFKSTNGGTTFTPASTYYEAGGNYIHPDIHAVEYNPLNNYLFVGGDGGFHRSANTGTNWTDLYSGIEATQFYHMTGYDANQNTVLAGCQDNGVKYKTTNTASFSHIYCCDGGDGIIQYNDQTKGYAGVNTSVYQFTNFTTTSPTSIRSNGNYFMQMEMHSSNPDIIYIGDNWVYRFVASTGITTQLGATARGSWVLKTCPSNINRIYAAGGTTAFAAAGSMYESPNGGTNWNKVSTNPNFPANFPRISDIGVKPNNSLQVYVCFSGYTDGVKVFYSNDAGGTWTNASYDLPNVPVWSIEVDASNNVYIGCDIGVYYKAGASTHWEPFYNGLPNVPVSDLAINEGADQLLASTFGRGIWKSSLRASCPISTLISTNVSGPYFRSASSSITMTSQVTGGAGTSAVLRAGSYIDLSPGFRADGTPGNEFLAYIGPCDSGIPPSAPSGSLPETSAGTILDTSSEPASDAATDTITPDQYPVYPRELSAYEMLMTRHLGTIEVTGTPVGANRPVIVRTFNEGEVRLLLASATGTFIRDVANFSGDEGTYTYSLNTSGLDKGLNYLYLVVNGKVSHLQEVEVGQ